MKKNIYFILDHYDRQIIPQIIDKYNLPPNGSYQEIHSVKDTRIARRL